MKNNILVVCLMLIIAILLGAVVFMKVANDSRLIKVIAQQQQQIVSGQEKINASTSVVTSKIKAMESRLSVIEDELKRSLTELKMKQGAGALIPSTEDFNKVYDIPLGKSTIRGNTNAKVTIAGFLDLQCPFSARFEPMINQVLEAYPGKVNYIIKHFPLPYHKQARPAAKAVLAAGEQGKYWEMVNLILQNRQDLSEDKLEGFAKSLKLNMKKFQSDLKKKDSEWGKLIQDDYDLGLAVDVRGTPTYYINGRKTEARDLSSFKKEIDAILSK